MDGQKHLLVLAVRHGQTILNAKDAFRGPIDAPLDAQGFRDANEVAHYLESEPVSAIFHSDKKRTRATAETIARLKKMEVYPNPNLAAWNVGDLGGQPKDEENTELVHWHVEHPDVPLPGGESLNQFKARIHPLIIDATDLAMKTGLPVVLVVHSSVIHEIGNMIGGHHEYTLVEPGGVAAIYIQDGKLDACPIFKARPESKSRRRADIMT
jgi:broad specificity phosphatase PhoE